MEVYRNFGKLSSHAVGIIMRELVQRAIFVIRNERTTFEAHDKRGKTGQMDDVVTSADFAAQEIYVKSIRECFPTFGIIGEEKNLMVPSSHKTGMYFTIDPLDGTKAFARRQSHGVGTMLALVDRDEVIAAAIGDINTQEIFYYRPESNSVWRIFLNGGSSLCDLLRPDGKKLLADSYILLRDNPADLSEGAQIFSKSKRRGGMFKNLTVTDGSIGISMSRLWKGEVGAHLLNAGVETPWDACPVLGISQKLGFVFLDIDPANGKLSLGDQSPISKNTERPCERLVIHREYLSQIPWSLIDR